MMDLRPLAIDGVMEIIPKKFSDERGYFAETYSLAPFLVAGIAVNWVQDNQSYSREAGVLRGLHFQVSPYAQDKLIRVLRGSIFDVAVDVRKGSVTFGSWVSCKISAARFNQVYVPKGFAHGFVTLEPDTEVFYKVSAPYSPLYERSISHADVELNITWPLPSSELILSAKDRDAPRLTDIVDDISFD